MISRLSIGIFFFSCATAFADQIRLNSFVAEQIVNGYHNTCILSTSGQVKCWGINASGQLGTGDLESRGVATYSIGQSLAAINLGTDFRTKNLCAGEDFICANSTSGFVKCWGANKFGMLGQEHRESGVGFRLQEMGDALPFTNLGAAFRTQDIQCGKEFVCALSTDGQVKCWGSNSNGQLGVTNPKARTHVGTEKGDMGDNLAPLPLGGPVSKISVGSSHACAVVSDAVFCWGSNRYGESGSGTTVDQIDFPADGTFLAPVTLEAEGTKIKIEDVSSGSLFNCALYRLKDKVSGSLSAQKLKCWGHNSLAQLGTGQDVESRGREARSMGLDLPRVELGISEIGQLATKSHHTCVLSRGKVKCWGKNGQGQLGYEDTDQRGNRPQDMGENLGFVDLGLPVLRLSTGKAALTCALLVNHEVKCWGRGDFGLLGYEDEDSRGKSAFEMGSNLPFVRFK